MASPAVSVVRRNAAAGAVCAFALVAAAELVVPAVLGGTRGVTARYALYLLAFSLWMAWFVLTGVELLGIGE